jgi:hypothetical protein
MLELQRAAARIEIGRWIVRPAPLRFPRVPQPGVVMAARKKSTSRKSSKRRYGKGASKSVESAMRRRKSGTLRRGKGGRGGKVKSRKQAVAIGLSEARKKGAKVPAKKSGRRKSTRKKSSKRSS